MKTRWFESATSRLARDSGLSKGEAAEVWNRFALAGYRGWKPWLWLAAWLLAWVGLQASGIVASLGRVGVFLGSAALAAGLMGSLWIAFRVSWPLALREARRRAGEREPGGAPGS